MTRLLRTTVLAIYAASLAAAVVALCPCPMDMKADAHDCCPKAGLQAATSDCCRTPTLQAKTPAVPERAALAPMPAPTSVGRGLPVTRPAVASFTVASSRTPSPPSVLRI